MSLFWRIFLIDAAVLTVAAVALAVAPVTVSTPVVLTEALILLAGLLLLLATNASLLRVGLAPLHRLTREMTTVDLDSPRVRPVATGPSDVATLIEAFNAMLERLQAERAARNAYTLSAQEGERRRIAQELHDEVGQTLTAVLLDLKRVGDRVAEPARSELREVQETTRDGLDEIRRIARRLRPGVLEELGLVSALRSLANEVPPRAGLIVRTHVDADLPPLSHDVELVIYRVAQESLTNTLRHARARRVDLSLREEAGHTLLVVRDDGRGLGEAPDGAGIRGMRERAMLIGGKLTITSWPVGGTEVRLEVPLR